MEVRDLSAAQCKLLAVHLASASNVASLQSLTQARPDVFTVETVLRIILTYLPESLPPAQYVDYVFEITSTSPLDAEPQDATVDTSPVQGLSRTKAEKKVARLHLLQIEPPNFPPHAPSDPLTHFVCTRAHRIDEETGLISLIPALAEPFLDNNAYLRTWYISAVLPLLRLEFEYYPDDEQGGISLAQFERLRGRDGVDFLLSKSVRQRHEGKNHVRDNLARDVKGLIGPWMYGHSKRPLERSTDAHASDASRDVDKGAVGGNRTPQSNFPELEKAKSDWEYLYQWLVERSHSDFPLVASAIENWNGPGDVELGDLAQYASSYLDEDTQAKLEVEYAQSAFAACYAVEQDDEITIRGAYKILKRLADLLDFESPPDLSSNIANLPRLQSHSASLKASQSIKDLLPDVLLRSGHSLTTPSLETYMILQMMVFTAYQLSELGKPISITNVAKLHFYGTADEQLAVLQSLCRDLTKAVKRDDNEWMAVESKLLWLRNWGIAKNDAIKDGAGVFGRIPREQMDEEMLQVFIDASKYHLAIKTFIDDDTTLPHQRAEKVVIEKALEAYDGASNGNKTRGGMKKCDEIISAFEPRFQDSLRFKEVRSLIKATHSISFYSLTLHHGVPFKPFNIRLSQDPIKLLSKILQQNPNSFTKLDDLLLIARNIVAAGLLRNKEITTGDENVYFHDGNDDQASDFDQQLKNSERRVTFMAIDAALREDDFETAYSYIINKLAPSPSNAIKSQPEHRSHRRITSKGTVTSENDDISWRAALAAGRYRPATANPSIRRLEQRTELLSLALLLAPTSALTEILGVWRRCEEEIIALNAEQAKAEQEFDDQADRREASGLPGHFRVEDAQPDLILNQKRREVGRLHGRRDGGDEVPVSMFDLTRSAARAFSRGAFLSNEVARNNSSPVSVEKTASSADDYGSLGESSESLDVQHRARKRDMVASAASGALASGLGWVLGATPVNQDERSHQ